MNGTATTGFTSLTPSNLLLDSGAIYTNYGTETEKLLCATSGGNEFDISQKTRQVKVDGVKGSAKGLQIVTDTEVTLKANLLEVTSDVLKTVLMANVDTATNPDYNIITGKTYIADSDYITNIALVATISGSTKPIIIILKNVLNTDGLKLKTEDDKDNVLPVTFTAFIDPATPTLLPYEIHYPKAAV